jgi:DNA polymerase IV
MTGGRRGIRDIIHLDMDAFYASVETLDNPALRGKPVIVGGRDRRGVVCAASYEARRYGVHSAQPAAAAKRLCPHGVFLPVRMARYKEVSEAVFAIFRRFTPLVERLSIDEAFLDVTGSIRLFGPSKTIARAIKEAVRHETGLTVSAGVASSKLVAKIASDMSKPDGLTAVPPGTERAFLAPLPVEKLWGVGHVTRETLEGLGVRTIGDLGRVPAARLERRFGAAGLLLHRLALGVDDRDVEPEGEAKSIGHEDTYPEDVLDPIALRRELLRLSERVAARLRRHEVRGRTVTLRVKYHDFVQVTRAATLAEATDDGREICRCARALLGKTEAGEKPVRLLGISLSNLEGRPGGAMGQLPLFGGTGGSGGRPVSAVPRSRTTGARGHSAQRGDDGRPPVDPTRRERLNRALDAIRKKFGERGILPGTLAE